MDLFELGRQSFQAFIQEFAAYGLHVDPSVELRRATGLLCYYDLKDGHIYLSVPGTATPTDELQALMVAAVMGCDGVDELFRVWALLIPRLIAHELGHYFRQRHGVLRENLWYEEQVANQLASAVTKHRMSPADRAFAVVRLRTAIQNVAARVEPDDIATLSYDNVLDALHVMGYIGDADQDSMEVLGRLFSVSPEEALKASGHLTENLAHSLAERDRMIAEINSTYISDFLQYLYCHLGWTYVDLISPSKHFVDEFARVHLNRQVALLPRIEAGMVSATIQIQACFQAYLDVRPYSEVAARHFYKRYRTLLLSKLQSLEKAPGVPLLSQQTIAFLANWGERDIEGLDYAAHLAPAPLHDLAPSRIEAYLDPALDVERHLPTETDRRLWRHVVRGETDEGAANTLHRLTLLSQTRLFHSVSAEAMLDLVHTFCRVKLAPGETIIWESERDTDVFIVVEGELEVLVAEGEQLRPLTTIGPGETVGEIAFVAREARAATVRARSNVDCYVIRDADLQILCYEYPSILVQIAGGLARSLRRQTQRAQKGGAPSPTARSDER